MDKIVIELARVKFDRNRDNEWGKRLSRMLALYNIVIGGLRWFGGELLVIS